jgi:hypothetical protein
LEEIGSGGVKIPDALVYVKEISSIRSEKILDKISI